MHKTIAICVELWYNYYNISVILNDEQEVKIDKKKDFKPYIPASKVTPELTVTSIIIGILLAVIFGAANAYLGLRVGMTVSASIPAAVIAMGVIRVIMKKNSILESNLVQTIGSAGEGLVGILLALLAVFGVAEAIDLSKIMNLPTVVSNIGSIVVFGLIILILMKFSLWKKTKKDTK